MMFMSKKRLKLMVSLFLLTIFLILPFTPCVGFAENSQTNAEELIKSSLINGKFIPLEQLPKNANQVSIGIYPINVYDLKFESNTYYMSAYVWFAWKGDVDPSTTMEFVNAVEEWGMIKTPLFEAPKTLPDGTKYLAMRINARFYQPFDLKNYPLDTQYLNFYIEDSSSTYDQVVYIADNKNTGYDASLNIQGWDIKSLTSQKYVHDYGTNFGDLTAGPDASKYSSLKFTMEIKRNTNFFYFKLLLPLIIVLLTNWFALLLKPTFVEVRTAMPATSLLTAIFLQLAYSDKLPELSYMVLMDKIYVLVYVMIVATFMQIILLNQKLNEDDQASIDRIVRFDKISVAIHVVVFVAVMAYLILA